MDWRKQVSTDLKMNRKIIKVINSNNPETIQNWSQELARQEAYDFSPIPSPTNSANVELEEISVESGNSTVVEMEVTATMTGEMPMPDGSSIPPSGKTHTFKACMIIDWDNGQIKKQRIYADFMSFMAGFGIMPS